MFVYIKLQHSFSLILLCWILTNGKASDVKGGFLLLAKGHRLKKSLIKETQVDSAVHCIQQCRIHGPLCLSINYGISSYAKGICQLNKRAAVGADEADLIVDKDFDYFERDTVRQQSLTTPPESCPKYALIFKGSNTKDYVISTGAPAMKAITICFWIKINHSVRGEAYVSYAVTASHNQFLIYHQTNLQLWLSGSEAIYPSRGPSYDVNINDGKWHHICVTWQADGGLSQIYKDGAIAKQGSSPWSVDKTIQGGGTWVLGHDQDEVGGGFDVGEAMQGEMFCCNVWSHVLSSKEILQMSKSCEKCRNGNVKTWDDFLHGIRGEMEIIYPTCS